MSKEKKNRKGLFLLLLGLGGLSAYLLSKKTTFTECDNGDFEDQQLSCGLNNAGIQNQHRDCVNRKWTEWFNVGPCNDPDVCVNGTQDVMTCPDQSQTIITTANCSSGDWFPTNEQCPKGWIQAVSLGPATNLTVDQNSQSIFVPPCILPAGPCETTDLIEWFAGNYLYKTAEWDTKGFFNVREGIATQVLVHTESSNFSITFYSNTTPYDVDFYDLNMNFVYTHTVTQQPIEELIIDQANPIIPAVGFFKIATAQIPITPYQINIASSNPTFIISVNVPLQI